MPELPEVETTRQGLIPLITTRRICTVSISPHALRQPFPPAQADALINAQITTIDRRGKYLIIRTTHEQLDLLAHLGMSGSLRVNSIDAPKKTHDHIIISLDNNQALYYHDPRRFGFIKTIIRTQAIKELQHLGAEPLENAFNGQYLYQHSRRKKQAIKNLIMNQKIVVGVGNIYASEALFHSKIHPEKSAKSLTQTDCDTLSYHIKEILKQAIKSGGTTLKDFMHSDGRGGYFQQTLSIYGKDGEPCPNCKHPIARLTIGGRSSCYCPQCQIR